MSSSLPEHVHRPIGQIDILDTIIAVCKGGKQYRTLLLLALMSKHHAAIVRPHLKKIKERVVLDLDEFDFRDKGNDENIEIFRCSRISPMPVDMDMLADTFQEHLIDLRTRLKPAIVVCTGPPIASIPQTLHQLFPTIRIFVVSEDARHLRLEEANDSSSPRERALKAVGAFHDMFRTYCLNTSLQDPPIQFRYRLHRNHMPLQTFLPGQRLYILKAITSAGHSIESSVWLSDRHFQQPAILDECRKMLPNHIEYKQIEMRAYVQLSQVLGGEYFRGPGQVICEGLPAGYTLLTEMVKYFSAKYFHSPTSRFQFSLSFLRHGFDPEIDLHQVKPIFQTTCSNRRMNNRLSPHEVDRFVDENFVNCVVNGGCARCRRI